MPAHRTTLMVRPTAAPPIDHGGPTGRTEEVLRRAAAERSQHRAGLRVQVLSFLLVVLVVVALWGLGGGGVSWPFVPLAFWGVGLALHALAVWSRTPTEAEVRAELLRMTR
ncbi:2TM domain-containing protein [Aquipuribacter sp. MA13-6]|uniref:2TM domain-containing protein n=1 Tax=unclassified Aquipuribacter TaxID=2635084 RepID=UPI003EF0317D